MHYNTKMIMALVALLVIIAGVVGYYLSTVSLTTTTVTTLPTVVLVYRDKEYPMWRTVSCSSGSCITTTYSLTPEQIEGVAISKGDDVKIRISGPSPQSMTVIVEGSSLSKNLSLSDTTFKADLDPGRYTLTVKANWTTLAASYLIFIRIQSS